MNNDIQKEEKSLNNEPGKCNYAIIGASKVIETMKPVMEQAGRTAIEAANLATQLVNPMLKAIQSLSEAIRPLIEQSSQMMKNLAPFFSELASAIEELKNDPDNAFNWIKLSKSLSKYFWLPPYMMDSDKILELLEKANDEAEIDDYLQHYFTKEIIDALFDDIKYMSLEKHKEILLQIEYSYNNGNYALANTGLFSVIDSLCGYFVKNKKRDTYRINLFEPTIKVEKRKSNDYIHILIMTMINSNINFLYGKEEKTHKLARRHLSQHGEFFSNNKIDTILLLHTTHYLLVCIDNYKEYKGKLVLIKKYVDGKKIKKYIIEEEKTK